MGEAHAFWMRLGLQTPQQWVKISYKDGSRPDKYKSFVNEGSRLSASPSLPRMYVHLSTNSHGLPGPGWCGQLVPLLLNRELEGPSTGCLSSCLYFRWCPGVQGLQSEGFDIELCAKD